MRKLRSSRMVEDGVRFRPLAHLAASVGAIAIAVLATALANPSEGEGEFGSRASDDTKPEGDEPTPEPADFVLVDTKSGAEHRIPIEAGTHITYDNSVYEHRVDAHPDSKRTLLGPASLPSGGRRLEAVGNDSGCSGCTSAEYEQQCNDCSSICLWQDQCEVARRNPRFGVAATGCCTYDCRRRLTAEETAALSVEQLEERRRLC